MNTENESILSVLAEMSRRSAENNLQIPTTYGKDGCPISIILLMPRSFFFFFSCILHKQILLQGLTNNWKQSLQSHKGSYEMETFLTSPENEQKNLG